MTTSSIASVTARDGSASVPETPDLRPALRRLARAAGRYAEAKQSTWTEQIKGLIEPAGATDRAVIEALKAWVTGGNPAAAALRGAWVGADGKTKVAIVAVLLLVVVLAPVLVLLILLGPLITAIALKARATAVGGHACAVDSSDNASARSSRGSCPSPTPSSPSPRRRSHSSKRSALPVWMLTGDNAATPRTIADIVGIGHVISDVVPANKAAQVTWR